MTSFVVSMLRRWAWLLLMFSVALRATGIAQDLAPAWQELNARTPPAWFADARFGIFIHWGVYSVPAYCHRSTYSEWYQHWVDTSAHDGFERRHHEARYGKDFAYRDFAPEFRAEHFDPAAWAELFERAGARYVVLTSKHHDGYCLWPSEAASRARGHPWNSAEVGPRRDLVGDLSEAVRARGLRMGLYYSLMEWKNPLFDSDRARYVQDVMIPQVQDLIQRYRPSIFWPDGEWEHPDTLWRSPEVLRWIYEHAPNRDELVVNDRWGRGLRSRTGDFFTTEYGNGGENATSLRKPFEECRGIGHSFAYNRLEDLDAYATRTACVRMLIDLVSKGGNLLLDIGPTADGRIPVIMQDRLVAMGEWLSRNGESIYGAGKSPLLRTPFGTSTRKGATLYLHVYEWPGSRAHVADASRSLVLPGLKNPIASAWMLKDGPRRPLPVGRNRDGEWVLDLTGRLPDEHATVIAVTVEGDMAVDPTVRVGVDVGIRLDANEAVASGGVKLERHDERILGQRSTESVANLGFWTRSNGAVEWRNLSIAAGTYALGLEVSADPAHAGNTVRVDLAGKTWSAIVPSTGSWRQYQQLDLGILRVEDPTPTMLRVHTSQLRDGTALMNLRAVTMRPVLTRPRTLEPAPSEESRSAAAGWTGGRTWRDQHWDIVGQDRAAEPEIVLLGDSILQGLGGAGRQVSEPGAEARERWLSGKTLGNYAIAGDRTQHVLWRLANGALSHARPRLVVLLIGTNNLPDDDPEDVAAGIEAIVNEIVRKAAPKLVLVLSILPRGVAPDDPLRGAVERVHRVVKSLGGPGVRYLDLTERLVLPDGHLDPSLMAADGVHLLPGGYDLLAEVIAKAAAGVGGSR